MNKNKICPLLNKRCIGKKCMGYRLESYFNESKKETEEYGYCYTMRAKVED
jgi:hypothetical protein